MSLADDVDGYLEQQRLAKERRDAEARAEAHAERIIRPAWGPELVSAIEAEGVPHRPIYFLTGRSKITPTKIAGHEIREPIVEPIGGGWSLSFKHMRHFYAVTVDGRFFFSAKFSHNFNRTVIGMEDSTGVVVQDEIRDRRDGEGRGVAVAVLAAFKAGTAEYGRGWISF